MTRIVIALPFQFGINGANLLMAHADCWIKCVFRRISDSDSDLIRTAIRFISDTVPIQFGRRSGELSDSCSAPSDGCPDCFGRLSELRRISAVGVA